MANYNSNLHPENDIGSVVFPNINGQSIPENAITPSKVAAGQFPQVVAGSVQNPLTIVTAEGQTEYDGSDAVTIDISSPQDADHAHTADRATADGNGANIANTYAKQNGTYGSLISGGVQAKQLTSSDDLNDYIGSAYWGKQYYWTGGQKPANSPSKTRGGSLRIYRAGNGATAQFFTTHVASDASVIPTSYQRTYSDAWSGWEEFVTSDGDYETLGAGYLSRYGYVNASAMGWYKIATVDISQAGLQYNSYSCRLLVNGIHATQQFAHPNRSGDIELDVRYDGGSIDANQTGITVLSGNLDPNDFCITISGNVVTLYMHMPYQSAQSVFVILQEACENTPIAQILKFTISNVGTSAPSGAVYATVKNGADHLVLPAAVGSTTTPVYFNADGVPQPCALPVSKYYNHTFRYQPSAFVQASDFSFIFSVVLDVATPIPAGNTTLWGAYLNLPQTSLAPMPSNSKFFPATGIIKQDGQVGHIMGVGLAAQPLGVNLIASIYYEYNGTTGVYPASNSHVVLDPDRISESVVTP